MHSHLALERHGPSPWLIAALLAAALMLLGRPADGFPTHAAQSYVSWVTHWVPRAKPVPRIRYAPSRAARFVPWEHLTPGLRGQEVASRPHHAAHFHPAAHTAPADLDHDATRLGHSVLFVLPRLSALTLSLAD